MTPKGNTSNHPPRRGSKITPHKGGRSVRISSSLTPDNYARLRSLLDARSISLSDWIGERLGEDEARIVSRDEIMDLLAAPSWEDVESTFAGKDIWQVNAILTGMFPDEDNWFLARSLVEKLS